MAMGWFYVKKILKNPALIGVAEEEAVIRHLRVRKENRWKSRRKNPPMNFLKAKWTRFSIKFPRMAFTA